MGPEAAEAERNELAHLVRYLLQMHNPRIVRKPRYEDVKFKEFASTNRKGLAKLHFILKKYSIDAKRFVTYAVEQENVARIQDFFKTDLFRRYSERLLIEKRIQTISKVYAKSVENVARACVETGRTPVEFIKAMVNENRVAYYYISGWISKYFLVSIRNFGEIFSRLDSLNKDELRIIYDAEGEMRTMATEALVATTGKPPRPVHDVQEAIKRLTSKNQLKTKSTNQEN